MKTLRPTPRMLRVLATALLAVPVASFAVPTATALTGLWEASVHVNVIDVPFPFGIEIKGEQASGWFFNGDEKIVSSSGSFTDGHLLLRFASYGKNLDARLTSDGTLEGVYAPTAVDSPAKPYAFHAHRQAPIHASAAHTYPSIAGQWLLPTQGDKAGEQAWRLVIRQQGDQVSAAILRVDGDTGALTGHWQDGRLLLSHFDGARPAVVEVQPLASDGTLHLTVHNSNGTDAPLVAYRQSDARVKALPQAADPATHTRVKDPNEPLHFSFPNLEGQIVSNTDGRFHGKVVLVDISGSWCPNCHDEAPFLEAMYRKYHGQGLEIVTLNFEDSPAQLTNPARLRAFIKDFDLQYIVLQAGTTDQLQQKLPQAVNLDSYPTTFFIGRDGLVKAVHAGFAAKATGELGTELKKTFAAKIEQLLAEKPAAKVARR